MLAAQHRNLLVVGDTDQCLVVGTQITMGDGSCKAIEAVRVGDDVRTHKRERWCGSSRVERVYKGHTQQLVRVELASARALVSTPEHVHFAGEVPVGSLDGVLAPVSDPTGVRLAVAGPEGECALPMCRAAAVEVGMTLHNC